MGFMDKMKDSFSEVTESARLTGQIKNNLRMADKIINQVGIRCYELHGRESGTEYDEMFSEINRLYAENAELQKQVDDLAMKKVCPQCGCENRKDAKFCVGCGMPLADIQPMQNGGGGAPAVCGKCGTANEPDAMFCVECGNKLR